MLASPLTRRVPTPLADLSAGFLENNGRPAFLTMPCDGPEGKAYDLSGSGNPAGAEQGGVTVVPGGFGVLGQGWNLNGTSGYLKYTSAPILTGNMSAVMAVTFNTVPASAHLFGFYNSVSPFQGWGVRIDTGPTSLQFWDSSAWNSFGWLPSAGVPYVLAITVSGTSAVLYANGAQVGTATVAARSSWGGPYVIGATTGGAGFLPATIYLVELHASALPSTKISSLYNALLTGEPYPLFAPTIMDRWGGLSGAGGPASYSAAAGIAASSSQIASSIYSAAAGIASSLGLIASSLQSAAASVGAVSAEVASSILAAVANIGAVSSQSNALVVNALASFAATGNPAVLNNLLAIQENLSAAAAELASSLYGAAGTINAPATESVTLNLISASEFIEALAAELASSLEQPLTASGASATVVASSLFGGASRLGASASVQLGGQSTGEVDGVYKLPFRRRTFYLPIRSRTYNLPPRKHTYYLENR